MSSSVFDIFSIGIGPSSSHTVGPMRAANRFAHRLDAAGELPRAKRIEVDLFGSLGFTGKGHGSDVAVLLGLEGELPECVDPSEVPARLSGIRARGELHVLRKALIAFDEARDLHFHARALQGARHPNALRFRALDTADRTLVAAEYFSVGGGAVVGDDVEEEVGAGIPSQPYPFRSARDLLELSVSNGLSVGDMMWANECALRPESEVRARLAGLWRVMQECVARGCRAEGVLPGGLGVERRAPALYHALRTHPADDPLVQLDWVNLYALAVNEENAAGGRIVTAPTNGAAGIVPAVLHYYARFHPVATDQGCHRFLLTAGAIGLLYRRNASISGAEVGCQGEVGVACSMAAGALTEALGGTPAQVENAAEIGMEHNLGLTCDPIAGLVQIPCIERNAMGAVKAINAARLALAGSGRHYVSLDRVIAVMRQTGADMSTKYKETARGGLAVNVIEC